MDTTTLTMDTIEQTLAAGEATIARVRRSQMVLIREADRRQAPLADGSRSLAEWVTARLDVGPETATALVSTARRLEALPTVEQATTDGALSFDRTVAVAKIAIPSEDQTIISELSGYDVAAIRRLRSNRHRMTRDMEREAFEQRYMVAQPNLDESSWRVHGQLPGAAGRVFVEALDAKADQLPRSAQGDRSRTTRWADALWAMSLDSLAGSDGASIESATPLLTVFMDAHNAAPTNGEASVTVEAGPRVGLDTVEAILCDGVIEVTARAEDGVPVNMGRRSRTIPPGRSTEYSVLSTQYGRRQAARCSRARVHHRPLIATPTPTIPPTDHPRTTHKARCRLARWE